jgi:hypothetical protein
MTTAACESPADIAVSAYLANKDVRRRIVEYCGGSARRPPTAAYVAALEIDGGHMPSWDQVERKPPDEIAAMLGREVDLARSLWDTEDLLFFLDIDYVNGDAPADPFLHPADMLLTIEPVYSAARAVFSRLGLGVRAFVTGRGYHFIGQVPLVDPLVDAIAEIVPATPPWHAGVEHRRPKAVTAPLSARHARAADGIGCLVEYAAHLILDATRGTRPPVVFNGTLVGHTGPAGRECISIDFSYAGDPLDVRHARVGFSPYQWHRARPDLFGGRAAAIAPLASLPRGRGSVVTLVQRRGLAGAIAAAARGSARIPNVRAGLENLRAAYTGSTLAEFHRQYFAELAAERERPLPPAMMLPCVAAAFAHANDLLLKPEHLQHVVRSLMSRGWRPAAIARLLESEYEHDHGWGDRWTARMHPRTRAEFEVRVFAGLLRTGRDPLIDFNCVSAQEKGICPRTACRADLRADAQRLAALL